MTESGNPRTAVRRSSGFYLIVHRVGSVLVGRPLHDARRAVVALEGQGALEGAEGRVLVRIRGVLIVQPVAEATHTRGDGLAALPAHAGEYLHFLSRSEREQPLHEAVPIAYVSAFQVFHTRDMYERSPAFLHHGSFKS